MTVRRRRGVSRWWRLAAVLALAGCASPPPDAGLPPLPGDVALSAHKPGWAFSRFGVAAANPLATAAGFQVLQAGGSAVDAAVAVQMVLTLVEPQSSGIGGGPWRQRPSVFSHARRFRMLMQILAVLAGLVCFAVAYIGFGLTHDRVAAVALIVVYSGFASANDVVGKSWVSKLAADHQQLTVQSRLQGLGSIGILIAGIWAGLAWSLGSGFGVVPLMISGVFGLFAAVFLWRIKL